MASPAPLSQLNIIVSDMDVSLAFYRRLGWTFETPTPEHSRAEMPNGVHVEFDAVGFVPSWDAGYAGATGGSTVLGVALAERSEVDAMFADLIAHGGRAHQPPYDAFWGSRYAIVDDPDGNPVGLMSPRDDSMRSWPPGSPPS